MISKTPEPWARLEEEFGLTISSDLRLRVLSYVGLLVKWGQRLNLTGLDKEEDILRHHFFEAFWAAEYCVGETARLVDIGSGAGFPGLGIALYRPDIEVLLIESNHKKAVFLEEVARSLGVPARVECIRAENFDGWNNFDLATLRAVRLGSKLLKKLQQARIELLWFHGEKEVIPAGWKVIESKKVPGSRNRKVSRLVVENGRFT
ncbi:MAG TPA: 16S rRNA (guanine(527)-N(7))-methyltransferase RsmG [Acidobacteriota bacterium]|nr:16S rRNA (guanine(527)-N(7))-methyltransferase RsmG [Acidobacteriota bacterium]